MSANPYSPPKAPLEVLAGRYWREGNTVVMTPGGTLPPRCVKCNEAAKQPMAARKLYWHHSGWYLLFFVNVVVYVIVALFVRRRAEVTYGVCARHQRRRQRFIAAGWGGFILGILLAATVDVALGIVVAIAAALAGLFGSRLAYPREITKEEVRLGGCGEAFLDSIEQDAIAATRAQITAAQAEGRAPLGTCPNCEARLPLDAAVCAKCKAVFGPESAWQVRA